MTRAIFLLAITVVLIAAARSFLPQETSLVGSGAALAFGFVLLAALQSGTIFGGLKLPRLTGYLVCGFVVGPSVLNFVTDRMLSDLKLVNGVAIGLIAILAGVELNFKRLKGKYVAILAIGGFSLVGAVVFITLALFLLSSITFVATHFLPFMDGMSLTQRAVISLVIGTVLAAVSPTVALALISETGSAGPISEIVLGLVVMGDLFIIFMFAGVNALANATFDAGGGGGMTELLVHIFGSVGVGLILGVVFTVYLKKVNQRVALFVFGVCFLCAEAGTRLHLDPLLMCLTAGLFLENVTDIEGGKLVQDLETAAMPTFAVFFAVAGAGLHWAIFKKVAPVAVALALVRAGSIWTGARFGMALGRTPQAQRPFIPYGLFSQSGIAIGLAVLVAKQFKGWGEGASACLLGAVMLNELIGPVLFRQALLRSGEAGKREAVAGSH